MIVNRGLDHTTVLDITETADVGKGTFFLYFACKEQVIPALLERAGSVYQQALDRARSGESVVTVLEQLLAPNQGDLVSDHPSFFRSQVIAVMAKDDVRERSVRALAADSERLNALLTIGQERGEIRRDCSVAGLAMLILNADLGAKLQASWNPRLPPTADNRISSRQLVVTLIRASQEATPPPNVRTRPPRPRKP